MRKFQKKMLLELVETLYEAHSIINKKVENNDIQNIYELLTECQNTAIQMGTIIEKSEKKDTITVQYLEEYCEMLFQLYRCVERKESINMVYNSLNTKLDEVKFSLEKDIMVRLEIVFFPYKASMWDSMESVWKTAIKDPDCDVYVVPIPYYDRKPDGTFGKYHYEGDEYPNYVSVTNYESYDLKKRKPDVIYIHSPYDGYNLVTSVAPRFYSSELKKHTDMLVYIPYYIVANQNVNENMLKAAAYFNADKVIVQSKILRERCIDIYKNQYNISQDILEKRFVALGSPKIDAIVNSSKNDFTIPDEWRKMINKKKVVLYNTSINGALANSEKYLLKLEKTFNFFKDNEKFILWWRPHPLLITTFESMRSNLLERYLKILMMYKNNKIGIFDESPELQRAILNSDIYYGDIQSSVVALFCATGKPVVTAYINDNEEISDFDDDYNNYFRDNSRLDQLKKNEYYDGTSGRHIHEYIKSEVLKSE